MRTEDAVTTEAATTISTVVVQCRVGADAVCVVVESVAFASRK
jgi:hypothetical protein